MFSSTPPIFFGLTLFKNFQLKALCLNSSVIKILTPANETMQAVSTFKIFSPSDILCNLDSLIFFCLYFQPPTGPMKIPIFFFLIFFEIFSNSFFHHKIESFFSLIPIGKKFTNLCFLLNFWNNHPFTLFHRFNAIFFNLE